MSDLRKRIKELIPSAAFWTHEIADWPESKPYSYRIAEAADRESK